MNIDWPTTITVAIVAIAVTTMFAFACHAYSKLGIAAFSSSRTGAPKSFGLVWNRTVRLGAVVLIVVATVVLGFAGKLTEGAVGILSGIAGYVLGGTGDSQKPEKNDE